MGIGGVLVERAERADFGRPHPTTGRLHTIGIGLCPATSRSGQLPVGIPKAFALNRSRIFHPLTDLGAGFAPALAAEFFKYPQGTGARAKHIGHREGINLIECKTGKSYDQAVEHLTDLHNLANHQGEQATSKPA